jgi:hypothetical protein
MGGSDEGVVRRHVAPNGAWLPGRNVGYRHGAPSGACATRPERSKGGGGERRYAVGAGTRARTTLGASIQMHPVLVITNSATGLGLKTGSPGGRSNWGRPRSTRRVFTREFMLFQGPVC